MLTEAWQGVRRVLAVRMDNLGDVVMLSPALRSIRAALPQAHLTLMASPAGTQVAPLLPWVDDVLTWRASWQELPGRSGPELPSDWDLIERLRAGQYDAALIFTSFSQSPYPPAYALRLAGVPIRAGQTREFGGALLTHWVQPAPEAGHQSERSLHLLEALGFPIAGRQLELRLMEAAQERADAALRSVGVDPLAPFVALAPGASCTARRYPAERFAQVGRALADQSGLPVVILGSEKEQAAILPALQPAPGVVSLVGRTDFQELVGVIRRSSLVIANNSASLHLAEAWQRPMVILYSGTEWMTQWQPRFTPARLLRREVACSPCYRFTCPYALECLDVPAGEVVQAALELLHEAAPFPAGSGQL